MNTIDIFKRINKDKKFKDNISTTDIARMLDLSEYDYEWHEQEVITSYYFGSWYCTDSYVGFKVYFFNDEPMAVSSQLGRKCNEKIGWVSKDMFYKAFEYIKEFRIESEKPFELLENMEAELPGTYKIEFNGNLFDYHYDIPLYNGEKVKIIEKLKDPKYSQISQNVVIEFEDGHTKTVNVRQLDFPFNVLPE